MTCEVPDDTVTDIDADTLEHSLLDHNNESMKDNIQKRQGLMCLTGIMTDEIETGTKLEHVLLP